MMAGADPNIVNFKGMTALAYGIVSGSSAAVVNLLASRTTAGLKQVLNRLAQADFDIEGPLETFLELANRDQTSLLFERASFFGNTKLIDYLLNKSKYSWSRHQLRTAIENAEKSEKQNAVLILQRYFHKIDQDQIDGKLEELTHFIKKNKGKKKLK